MKIAFVTICTNHKYWQYVGPMIESARKYFLKNHTVDFLLWTDIPDEVTYGATVFPTEATDWPFPTLMRYHLFLQQEEKLHEYDYIFYCDADMLFIADVGDEILGQGLTAVIHPMYALRPDLMFPFEPNSESEAYVNVPRHYFAGGFQGGKSESFIRAMWLMKKAISADLDRNYTARWNDESHWNRYLYLTEADLVVLDPGYCYPDCILYGVPQNREYYLKRWGRDYEPKLLTVIKKFSLSKDGAESMKKTLDI